LLVLLLYPGGAKSMGIYRVEFHRDVT
jgi:hypothetical protein